MDADGCPKTPFVAPLFGCDGDSGDEAGDGGGPDGSTGGDTGAGTGPGEGAFPQDRWKSTQQFPNFSHESLHWQV